MSLAKNKIIQLEHRPGKELLELCHSLRPHLCERCL